MELLVSPPVPFGASFLGNPWMSWNEAVDQRRAEREWEALRTTLSSCGAVVRVRDPHPTAAAMTFTRDAAVVLPKRTVILCNDGPRGHVEPVLHTVWFRRQGHRTTQLPGLARVDGGNVLRCADGRWLVGLKHGAARPAERNLAAMLHEETGMPVAGVPLSDRRFLHLDTTLADLGGRAWLVHRPGLSGPDLDAPAWQAVLADRPVIDVTSDEAAHLACNVLVVGDTIVTGWTSGRLRRAFGRLGLTVAETPLNEFRKAGGGVHCLTLEIDPPRSAGDLS